MNSTVGAIDNESYLKAASLLAGAWKAATTIDFPSGLLPADRNTAYSIQDNMARLVTVDGANSISGWKVGATSPGVQKAEGYDGPIPGRVFASTVYRDGETVPLTRCDDGRVEAEIAFRFLTAPRGQDGAFSQEGLAEVVTALPAFDITGTRYTPACRAGWDGRQKMLAGIADNGNGGAVVLGEGNSSWAGVDFTRLGVDLRINGGHPVPNLWDLSRGDPFEALIWTVNQAYRRGFALSAGDVVLTGSLTEPQPVQPGDRVECQMPGLGRLRCQIRRA